MNLEASVLFQLPSLRALLMFEAASRLQSFHKASRELSTSPSAISHQIAGLEKSFGVQLFTRSGRGIENTAEGLEFAHEVRLALGMLESSKDRFVDRTRQRPVRIALHPPLAHDWLLPRLDSLNRAFPETFFDFVYAPRPSEAFGDEVDFAIDWGPETAAIEKGGQVVVSRRATVIASPDYLAAHRPFDRPDKLAACRILENSYTPHEWPQWCKRYAPRSLRLSIRHRFSSSALMMAAARRGFGVALACRNLLADSLATGELVAPFDDDLETGECYYLMVMPRMRDEKFVKSFTEWILAGAARQGRMEAGSSMSPEVA